MDPGGNREFADRVKLARHGPLTYVLYDFSGMKDEETGLRMIAEAAKFMESQPKASVYVLTDVTGSSFTQRSIDAMRDLGEHNKPWVRASAMVGMNALMRVVYRVVAPLLKRDIKVFETRAEGLAYLSAQSTAAGAFPRTP
jgi:hypothetical protein